MPSLTEYNSDSNYFKGLFVGKNGSGKTLALSSFPKPMKIYDFDGRLAPLINLLSDSQKDGIDAELIGPDKFAKFCNDFQELQDDYRFKTIVIDSLTSLSMTAVNYYLRLKGKTGGGKKIGTSQTQVPTWDEVNGETAVISQILDVAKVMKCHVIMTAHPVGKMEITANDKGGRKTTSIVAFGHKVPTIIPNYFNEIYQFFIESGFDNDNNTIPRYVIYTRPNAEEDMMKTALSLPRKIDLTSLPTVAGKREYNVSLWHLIQESMK